MRGGYGGISPYSGGYGGIGTVDSIGYGGLGNSFGSEYGYNRRYPSYSSYGSGSLGSSYGGSSYGGYGSVY